MTALGLMLFAIPIAFGVLRLVSTGSDYRYVVVALASTVGALVVLGRGRATTMARAVGAGTAAAGCSAASASLVGARNAVSVAIVALGFAVCSASGAYLFARSRAAGPAGR